MQMSMNVQVFLIENHLLDDIISATTKWDREVIENKQWEAIKDNDRERNTNVYDILIALKDTHVYRYKLKRLKFASLNRHSPISSNIWAVGGTSV